MGPPSTGLLTCPHCGYLDQVQKVSAVVSAGVSTGIYTGHSVGYGDTSYGQHGSASTFIVTNTTLTGGQQTVLSQRLAPPMQPFFQSPWGFWSITAIVLCALGASCAGLSGLAAVAIDPTNLVTWFTIIFFLAIFLGPVVLVVWLKMEEGKNRRAYLAFEYPRWQYAMAKWNDLYYCSRDDMVFLPRARQQAPADQMMWLLYQP